MSTRFQQSSPHIPRTKGAPFAILSSSVGKDFHKEGLMMRQFPYSTKTRDALGNPCFGGAGIESFQTGGSQPPSTAPPLPRSSSSCSNVSLSRRSLHNLTTSPPNQTSNKFQKTSNLPPVEMLSYKMFKKLLFLRTLWKISKYFQYLWQLSQCLTIQQ